MGREGKTLDFVKSELHILSSSSFPNLKFKAHHWHPQALYSLIIMNSEILKLEPTVLSPGMNPKAQEPGAQMSESRRRWMSHLKQRANLPFLSPFALCGRLVDWMMLT